MLTHIVFIKLKTPDEATMNQTREKLLAMKGRIPELLEIEAGVDVVRSERSFDVGLITRFKSLDAMRSYQKHPVHVEFLQYLSTVAERTASIDYEA